MPPPWRWGCREVEAAPAPSLRVGPGLYGSRSECNSGYVWRGKPCLIYSSTKPWCDVPSTYTLLQSTLDLYGRRALLGERRRKHSREGGWTRWLSLH